MPTYNVVMGQGVSVANLTGHILSTGMGEAGDRLQSCSAIILVNTVTHAGGLYHFPSGSINDDNHSQGALTAMANAVNPDKAYIVFGIAPFEHAKTYTALADQLKGHTQQMEQLRAFVRTLLPLTATVSSKKATGGVAWVTWNGAMFQVGLDDVNHYTDLRGVAAGAYANYSVYGAPL